MYACLQSFRGNTVFILNGLGANDVLETKIGQIEESLMSYLKLPFTHKSAGRVYFRGGRSIF